MAETAACGGKRKGAGRPPKEHGKTVVMAASVLEGLASELRLAEKQMVPSDDENLTLNSV